LALELKDFVRAKFYYPHALADSGFGLLDIFLLSGVNYAISLPLF